MMELRANMANARRRTGLAMLQATWSHGCHASNDPAKAPVCMRTGSGKGETCRSCRVENDKTPARTTCVAMRCTKNATPPMIAVSSVTLLKR